MPQAIKTKYIVLHCSAGFGDRKAIERFWKETLGWKSPGYHILIDEKGTIYQLANFDEVTNGVRGHNHEAIHICYIGGIKRHKVNGKYVAEDSRTDAQKEAQHEAIQMAISWLEDNGKDITKNLSVVGHRDFSKDKNFNGVIESWERIKECPSHETIGEVMLGMLYSSKDRYGKLPSIK